MEISDPTHVPYTKGCAFLSVLFWKVLSLPDVFLSVLFLSVLSLPALFPPILFRSAHVLHPFFPACPLLPKTIRHSPSGHCTPPQIKALLYLVPTASLLSVSCEVLPHPLPPPDFLLRPGISFPDTICTPPDAPDLHPSDDKKCGWPYPDGSFPDDLSKNVHTPYC